MTDIRETSGVDPTDVTSKTGADPDEFGVIALLALAAGGVLGSGWLIGDQKASGIAGQWAWVSWLIGGALMLIVALVMTELGRHAPENGGLIFWPFQSSGPLVALVVAAALWIFYSLNLTTEAVAVLRIFGSQFYSDANAPNAAGVILSGALMVPIALVNLFGLRAIRRGTVYLTAFKVVAIVTVLVLFFIPGFDRHAMAMHIDKDTDVVQKVIKAVVGGGIIYAYIGFQGPLDFAGQVTRKRTGRWVGEATRLRIAVLGTVVGSIVLYTLLQVVFLRHADLQSSDPLYVAISTQIFIFGLLVRIDTALSPAGAGIVFAVLLSREVESLSQVRLTDGRLARPRKLARTGSDSLWPIIVVNLIIGWIGLLVMKADWQDMASASAVLTLLVYVMPAVSLMAFRRHYSDVGAKRFQIAWHWWVLAWLSFVGGTEVLYWAGWQVLWQGAVLLLCGVVLLLGLPVLSRRIERFRLYDADNHAAGLWRRRNDADVKGAVVFAAFLGALVILSWLASISTIDDSIGSSLAALLGTAAFGFLCKYSIEFMRQRVPKLLSPSEAD